MLPVQALAASMIQDGAYTIEVTLSGGSGRAVVTSPAQLTVTDGAAVAVIIWSSPYYEYMLIDGTYYYPVNTDGNSTFEIPVLLDEDMAVSAQTVAMSQPHEIDYTLCFDSSTMRSADAGALTPIGVTVLAAGVIVILAAGIIVIIAIKRRRKNQKAAL